MTTSATPSHTADFRFAGHDVPRLAAIAGGTPFYAYDRRSVVERIQHLREVLPVGVQLFYSIKANPHPGLVGYLAGAVDGFDVASAAEMTTALAARAKGSGIHFAGPGKTEDELVRAVAAGVTVSIESTGEVDRVAAVSRRLGLRASALLRINPDFCLQRVGLKMVGRPSAFGMSVDEALAVHARLVSLPIDWMGYHFYWGSQCLSAEAILAAQRGTVGVVEHLAAQSRAWPRVINVGGGFGIPYATGEAPLDLAAVGRGMATWVGSLRAARPATEIVIELGRYMVGEAGIYVCRVVDRKVSQGRTFVITDGGMHQHLAASGHLGQSIRRPYPIVTPGREDESGREQVTLSGCLCTPIDTLATNVDLPRLVVGDFVVILQSGAYGATASPTRFLSHAEPREIVL